MLSCHVCLSIHTFVCTRSPSPSSRNFVQPSFKSKLDSTYDQVGMLLETRNLIFHRAIIGLFALRFKSGPDVLCTTWVTGKVGMLLEISSSIFHLVMLQFFFFDWKSLAQW